MLGRSRGFSMRRILIVAALLLAATAALAQSLSFPALSGRVVDDAGILDSALRERLTQKLAALEAKTTDQLVVATVKSLQGTSVEAYANALFKQWRLGQADKNNGVLLLVAPTERRVRIEVGSGLGSRLSDASAKAIIDNSILPRFRAGDFPDGIERGVDAIVQALSGASAWRIEWGPVAAAVLLLGAAAVILFTIFRGMLRAARRRDPNATWTDPMFWYWPTTTSSSTDARSATPSSSFDSGGFSGGGGDSGGGGASGSW
jgi:uncharacterized protein